MKKIVALSANEQKALFKEAAKIKKIPESMIEKVFWVCFVLERLFADKDGGTDTFSFPDEVSDTQRYKLFGNSVTIPVIKEMAEVVLNTLNTYYR